MQAANLHSIVSDPGGRCCICGGVAKVLRAWNYGKTPLCASPECAKARKVQRQRIRRRHKKAQLMLPLFS